MSSDSILMADISTNSIENNNFQKIETQYDLEEEFEDGMSISLQLELGGGMTVTYPKPEWEDKTLEEVNNITIEHVKSMLGEDSERFQEIKMYLEKNTESYKQENLHNIPLKEFWEKIKQNTTPSE